MTWVRTIGAVVVTAVAASAAVLAVQVYEGRHPDSDGPLPRPGDRATDAVAALTESHLYVAPELQGLLTPEEQARVAAAAAASEPAAFIALAGKGQAGYYLDADLQEYLLDGVAVDGSYLVWDGESLYADEKTRGGQLDDMAETDMAGKTEAALMRYVESVDGNEIRPFERFDYWGGPGGGFTAGLLMVSGGYAALMLLLGTVRALGGASFLLPGRWRDFFRSTA
ncbi:hypothetical protein [Mumia sp. ZJ430]|uniref:hypothetical protein n=1 Tax=Mumia sp. ZJ430 TaxID=2708083 RepID=UPI00141F91F7|nr:hypothetical protein [Mumia sp. ZJ430]